MAVTTEPGVERTFRGPYDLTEDQELFKRTVHEFAAREIVPVAHELDEREEYPRQTVARMGELGLLGLLVPETFGGAGASALDYVLAMEEVSWADASHAVVLSVTTSLVCEPIARFGTPAQQQTYLPALARGEYVGAYCLSEATSGSDAANMHARARRQPDGSWVLNGTKSWISNGGEAGLYLVYAVSDPDAPRAHGITAFLVPSDTPGLRAGGKEKKLGIRASSTCQMFFEDCRVPASAVLGQVDEGFRIAMATLDGGRIGIAAQALGIAQRAYDEAARYATEREAFGQPIADFQGLQWRLADMAVRIEASRLLAYRAARMKDAGEPFSKQASMAKLHASETAMFVTHAAVQMLGGYGFVREYPVEKLFRDAKITEIYEGTSEIQRLVIARHLLKEVRG
ncbi:MAG: acyl-CoA dehydrogenase [Chloroflexi bacterium]|nr:acyl-CoA dehydrogenase [Chloroflexota bacterium]